VKEATGRKGKDLFRPLRRALTGRDAGPEMADVMPLLRQRAERLSLWPTPGVSHPRTPVGYLEKRKGFCRFLLKGGTWPGSRRSSSRGTSSGMCR
jgi:hypothetical protein